MFSACSLFYTPELTDSQEDYIKEVITCNTRVASDFKLVNKDDIKEFFAGSSGRVKVIYSYIDDEIDIFSEFVILRGSDGENEFYLAEFDTVTFPMTECRKLKTYGKYYK